MRTANAKVKAEAKAKAEEKAKAKAEAEAKANAQAKAKANANPAEEKNPYELQREASIAQNKARMAALNIRSLAGAVQPARGGKAASPNGSHKRRAENSEDDDFIPGDADSARHSEGRIRGSVQHPPAPESRCAQEAHPDFRQRALIFEGGARGSRKEPEDEEEPEDEKDEEDVPLLRLVRVPRRRRLHPLRHVQQRRARPRLRRFERGAHGKLVLQ